MQEEQRFSIKESRPYMPCMDDGLVWKSLISMSFMILAYVISKMEYLLKVYSIIPQENMMAGYSFLNNSLNSDKLFDFFFLGNFNLI